MPPEAKAPIQILFLDDEELVRREAGTDLRGRLKEGKIEASVEAVETLDQAIQQLDRKTFHVAVIDLRLKGTEGAGNIVIRRIVETQILPIIVYTGYREELEPEFERSKLIHVVETKKMARVADKILEWHRRRVLEFFS